LKRKTFWEILSAHGAAVAAIGFPLTFPPLAVKGVMVSGYPAPHQGATLVHPPSFQNELDALRYAPIPAVASPRLQPRAHMARLTRHVQMITDLALRLNRLSDDVERWAIFGVQFQALDVFQHMFWDCATPEHPPGCDRAKSQGAQDFLGALDKAIQNLYEALRPTHVLILSDHGFGPAHAAVCVNQILLERGLLTLRVSRRRFRAMMALQVIVKSLDLLNLRSRLRYTMQKQRVVKMMGEAMRDSLVDARRSDAVCVSGGYCGLVRARPERIPAVVEALQSARHPRSREPLIEAAFPARDLWPQTRQTPLEHYVIVQPAEGFAVDTRLRHYGVTGPMHSGLTGTHRGTGILVSSLETLDGARGVMDIAPGLLGHFGLRPDGDASAPAAATVTGRYLPAEQADIEKRLRQLGYL
ncbi:MAG: alkaline phosphatase family protein, partial [Thermoflexales bacterium]